MMRSSRFALAVAALTLGVAPPAWAADGAVIYKEQCAKCHGETGKADTPVAQMLKVPSLVGDQDVVKMSAQEAVQAIKSNEKHPPTVKGMSDADLEASAEYAKTLAAE
jgi:mono/diheme cytochrome c family protein